MSRPAAASSQPRRCARARGITLLELLVVVALVALVAGLTYPGAMRGFENVRLRMACDDVAAFLSVAMSRVDRNESPVEVRFLKAESVIEMGGPGVTPERLELPGGIRLVGIYPAQDTEDSNVYSVLLMPGGAFPRLTVELGSQRAGRRLVRIDPITGVASIVKPEIDSQLEAR